MMRLFTTCWFIFFVFSLSISAQEQHCISHLLAEENIFSDKSLRKKREEFQNLIESVESDLTMSRSGDIISIPVVFHILYRTPEENVSDERIYEQLERLNTDFRFRNEDKTSIPSNFRSLAVDTGIEFCLAAVGPDGRSSSGIVRQQVEISNIGMRIGEGGRRVAFYRDLGGSDSWDTRRYMNVYVCDLGGIAGYAFAPMTSRFPEEDCVVVNSRFFGINNTANYNMGRILVHEVGHFFNLDHTWGKREGCEIDDSIRDTPLQFGPYFDCPEHPQVSCGTNDLYMNYMDYVNDRCMYMFTGGQSRRMLTSLTFGRPDLVANGICRDEEIIRNSGDLAVFPNPVSSDFVSVVMGKEMGDIKEILVFDMSGRLVWDHKSLRNSFGTIPVSDWKPGVYVVQIIGNKGQFIRKFVKTD